MCLSESNVCITVSTFKGYGNLRDWIICDRFSAAILWSLHPKLAENLFCFQKKEVHLWNNFRSKREHRRRRILTQTIFLINKNPFMTVIRLVCFARISILQGKQIILHGRPHKARSLKFIPRHAIQWHISLVNHIGLEIKQSDSKSFFIYLQIFQRRRHDFAKSAFESWCKPQNADEEAPHSRGVQSFEG